MRHPRDFYRLLHVQHDAPAVVIKASYRAMMQTLRCHPDLGGDEGNAKLLNEAMATLGDPVARAAYDAALLGPAAARSRKASGHASRGCASDARAGAFRDRHGPRSADATSPSGTATGTGASGASTAGVSDRDRSQRVDNPDFGISYCRFCHASRLNTWTPAAGYAILPECTRCGGPTRPVERFVASFAADRRHLDRRLHAGAATLWLRWPTEEPLSASLTDLSITGCALETTLAPRAGQVVLLNTVPLNAIAEVRSCAPSANGRRHRIGLAFLTVQTLASPGEFHAATA